MRQIFFLLGACQLLIASAQTGVLTRLHNGQSSFYYTTDWDANIIQTTIDACVVGDTLILPGGTFYLDANLLINKPVVIVGAGYASATNPVTQPTLLAQGTGSAHDVIIYNNAGGFSVHGIGFGVQVSFSDFIVTQNVDFIRCNLLGVKLGQTSGTLISQIHFKECLIGSLQQLNATAVTADNCIFKGTNPPAGITVRNSVIHNWMEASSGDFHNCIILRYGPAGTLNGSGSYFDCVFVALSGQYTSGGAAVLDNCQTVLSAALSTVFTSVSDLSAWSGSFNYHNPTGPATAHTAGIYFGTWPWKDGAIPFNPHWLGLTVPGATNGGVINVNLSGAAQQN